MAWEEKQVSRHKEWRLTTARHVIVWQVDEHIWYYIGGHPDFPNHQGKRANSVEEAKALAVVYYRMGGGDG